MTNTNAQQDDAELREQLLTLPQLEMPLTSYRIETDLYTLVKFVKTRERAAQERLLDELDKVTQAYHDEPSQGKAREKLSIALFTFIEKKRQALGEEQ